MITFVPGANKLSEGEGHMEENSKVNIKDNTVIINRFLPVPDFNTTDAPFPCVGKLASLMATVGAERPVESEMVVTREQPWSR